MPIDVRGPDGTIYRVNTNDEEVARDTVRRHLAAPGNGESHRAQANHQRREWDEHGNAMGVATQPAQPRQRREWDEQGRPVPSGEQATTRVRLSDGRVVTVQTGDHDVAARAAHRFQQANPLPRRTALQDAAGGINTFNQGFFLGAGDEISGGIGGLLDAGGEFFRQLPSGRFDNAEIGRAAQRGYRREADRARGVVSDFRQDRPRIAALTEGSGGATNMLMTLGATAPQQAAAQVTTRGLPLWANQTARGATVGGAYGGAYGFNAADGNLQERLDAGGDGIALGSAFGAAAPTAVNAARGTFDLARPAVVGLIEQMRRIPTPQPNSVGAMGRPMRPPPRPPARPPQLPRTTANMVHRLADRAEMSSDDVQAALAGARQRPQGQVLADVFGDPGVRTTRGIVQSPGRTGARAAETARARFADQPGRILRELRRGLQVGETRQAAIERLAVEYDQASARLYRPLWDIEITPQQRRRIESRVMDIYEDDPVFRDAMRRARNLFARDRRNGLVTGDINSNYLRHLHYLKLGLDDASQLAANPMRGGAGSTELRGIREMRARIIAAIDETVPEYAHARSQWGGLVNAEEALTDGADFLYRQPDQVRAALARMTDFERLHARIGLVDEITQGMRGGRVVGQRNVANALDYRDVQDVIAAAFDDPRQAAEFLDALNTSNQLARNAQQWLGGSQTASNVTHAADDALHTMSEMTGHVATGNPGAAVRRGVQGGLNAVTMGAVERANNVRGEALLRRVDTQDSAEFARQVVEELRRREAARTAATRASGAVGGASSLSASRDRQ